MKREEPKAEPKRRRGTKQSPNEEGGPERRRSRKQRRGAEMKRGEPKAEPK